MLSIAANNDVPTEVDILARLLSNEEGQLPATTARYYLSLEFSEDDKARMHDLAVRNQDGVLSSVEQQELFAYAKAGSLFSILKSRARRALRTKAAVEDPA
jgi:hypothetical protein